MITWASKSEQSVSQQILQIQIKNFTHWASLLNSNWKNINVRGKIMYYRYDGFEAFK
jgi:hypothetical protein